MGNQQLGEMIIMTLSYPKRLNSPKNIARGLFSALSIFVCCALFGIMGYWAGQPSFVYSIMQPEPTMITVPQTGGIYHPNIFITGAGRAIYKQWIEDLDGNIIFKYNEVLLSSDRGQVKVHQQDVRIPALKQGFYLIKAEVFIQPNPINSSKVDLIIGKIEVK